ncbi:hypothetical protein [Phosphitispora fastidiosa]|uniref:hypothetical protein n=1 Tax=Phosphitispora fastidiosa TaxID=2837202 RepID=UPI001E53BA35|nr:hypothetical protein [Phosphitispora fastidiosa]MBU7007184.1 tetrahydromethanopterin S-methyltransferase subunit B [Phosphitispora fastidiosa]
MEKILKQILAKIDGMESKMDGMESKMDGMESKMDGMESKLNELYERKDKIDESHEWLSAMHYSNQVHKAEVDRLNLKVATVEGALVGMSNSLDPFKKAQ